MQHLPTLIEDLAIILVAAAIVTLIFRRLGQPLVLGYIIAGFLVGPHFLMFPTIKDANNIKIWGEIGVIFLLFSLGLEFSFKKLARVGGTASIATMIEVSCMLCIGFITGNALGWSFNDSLFLAGIMSISSTTIIVRAFSEAGVKGRGFVGLVLGMLVVEDLIAILLLVFLSTLAMSSTVEGTQMVYTVAKLGFFLVLWFLTGVFILPTAMHKLRKYMSEETLLIVSLGLCFVMVTLTTQAGFSPALGAFIMGSMLSETREGKRIEHTIESVKNLFAAIFFVSVGMLIEPTLLQQYALPILIITAVILFGKTLSVTLGVLVAGRSLRHAVQSGLSLAQIGEFSFIIAGLGTTLKVTSDFLYPVAVGISAITAFTTPYMVRSADHIVYHLNNKLPARWKSMLENYTSAVDSVTFTSHWWKIAQAYLLKVLTNAVLVIAIFMGTKHFALPILRTQLQDPELAAPLALLASLVLATPFFWALSMGRIKVSTDKVDRLPILALEVSRWFVGILLIFILSAQFIELKFAVGLLMTLGLIFIVFSSRYISRVYRQIESRFIKNLEGHSGNARMHSLAPWDAHLVSLDVDASSPLIGRSLEDLKVREKYGITIVLIERGHRQIPVPGHHDMLLPNDKIFVIGTDDQVLKFKTVIEKNSSAQNSPHEEFNFILAPYAIDEGSKFLRKSIRDSGIREKSHGLVVGIERNGQRILNPDSLLQIEVGDTLWIVGEKNALKNL